jgi:hypothetical protein
MGGFRTDPSHRHYVHPDDVLRVDRQILLAGPIALYGPPDRDRIKLLFGPSKPPRLRRGARST